MLLGANAVAERLLSNGDTAKGCEVLANVVSGLRELRGDQHPDTIASIGMLAQAMSRLGADRIAESEALAREAARSARATLGERHPDAALMTATLAQVLVRRGAFGEAETLMRGCHEAATDAAAASGKTASLEMQITSSNLAQVLIAQERLHEAAPYAREALRSSEQVLGRLHEHTLDELSSLGTLLEALGETDEAEETLRTRLQSSRDALGEEHPATLVALSALARFLASQDSRHGALAEAERLMREDLASSRQLYGDRHVETLAAVSNLAQVYYKRGRFAEVRPLPPARPRCALAAAGRHGRFRATLAPTVRPPRRAGLAAGTRGSRGGREALRPVAPR